MATSARKFGEDAYGYWDRGEHGLPCYVFNPLDMPLWPHDPWHVIGNGHTSLRCQASGAFRLYGRRDAHCGAPVLLDALSLDLHCGDRAIRFLQSAPAGAAGTAPSVRWGIGHAVYSQSVLLDDTGNTLDVALDLTALPACDTFLATLSFVYRGRATQTLRVVVAGDVHAPDGAQAAAFLRNGVAIFPDEDSPHGDSFLAGGPEWTPGACLSTLTLERSLVLEAGAEWESGIVFGVAGSCSIPWVQSQWETARRSDALRAWGNAVLRHRPRAPELWMQEEVQWVTGRFLTLTGIRQTEESVSDARQHGRERIPAITALAEEDPGQALLTTIPLWRWDPERTRHVLIDRAARQGSTGCFSAAANRLDPRCERSHVEICFLVACAAILQRSSENDLVDTSVPFRDRNAGPLWDHIVSAVEWVRSDLGIGSHGLIRILNGDLNPAIDRAGVAGAGESTLNTAMMVYALHILVDCARRRNRERLATDWSAWARTLREAVSDAYGRDAFVRAYTDNGDPVGDGRDTVFADVQAWAVIARCGTDSQRRDSLDTVLRSTSDAGLPALTVPYCLPPPDVSSWRTAPGHGWNGGVCAVTAAWVVWALAVERRLPEALAEWERASVRRRAALNPKTAVPWLTNTAETASHLAGGRAGGPDPARTEPVACLPELSAVAWSEFALHMAVRE